MREESDFFDVATRLDVEAVAYDLELCKFRLARAKVELDCVAARCVFEAVECIVKFSDRVVCQVLPVETERIVVQLGGVHEDVHGPAGRSSELLSLGTFALVDLVRVARTSSWSGGLLATVRISRWS